MLFQPTNIIPDLRTGIGLGTVDVSNGLQVSWQVNGDYPVMTAFRIVICQNDAGSTELLDTGRLTTGCPFNGRDAMGEIDFFAYIIEPSDLASHGIINGEEYKLLIRQYYMGSGAETSIQQSSASVFVTRSSPSFGFSPISVTSAEYTFSVIYSQTQGDTVEWIRYQLQVTSGGTSESVYDSGKIFGTPIYEMNYSGFLPALHYSVRATGQTSSGVSMDTGWVSFTPSYSLADMGDVLTATCRSGKSAVLLSWTNASPVSGQDIWIVYRQKADSLVRMKLAEVPVSTNSILDFGAGSGQGPYTYYLYAGISATPNTTTQYLGVGESNAVSPVWYQWSLLECSGQPDGTWLLLNEYDFRLNLDSGSVSNNNSPGIQQNFTTMPTVQPAPQNYLTGTLTALTGAVSATAEYTDTIAVRNRLMALSATTNAVFLKSSRGDVFQVRIGGPVTSSTTENTKSLAQSVSVPWVEIDDDFAVILGTDF